ncbi:Signal transduction histidine kinase [Bizionia echini]|uniref:histidine kinase n=1 Tax=Bizionia echini TaxID=649333 RepID=A0A1I4ZBC1_9FLAO|nr:response regulator [Bizionia echini]SFN47571.1 Signal transduction histidine kinase [Bizionia echini]
MRSHFKIFLWLVFFSVLTSHAQKNIFEIQSINVKDGLPNSNTHDILQDQNNFIWISTLGGLTRYDGYAFKFYDASFFNINENASLVLALDEQNRIWFCEDLAYAPKLTSGVFNTETGSIIPFEIISKGLFTSEDVFSLNASNYRKNTIFITTKQGVVYKYDGQFKMIFTIPNFRFRRVVAESDLDGNYWITYDNTVISKIDGAGKILKRFNLDKDDFTLNKILITTPNIILEGYNSKVEKEYWQIKDTILQEFKLSIEHPIQVLKIKDSQIYFFQNDTVFKKPINPLKEKNNQVILGNISNLKYNSCYVDKQGVMWVSSDNGLYKIVSKKNPFTIFESENSIRGIYRDSNSNLWIGGYKKSVVYNLNSKAKQDIEVPNVTFTGFTKDKNGTLWIGTTNNSLYTYHSSDSIFKEHKKKQFDALQLPYLNPVTHKVWLGTGRGLAYIDDANTIQDYTVNKSIIGSQIRQFFQTKEGIWMVTNKGLFLMDATSEIITNHYSKANGFPTDNINHMHKDADGIFWLATKTDGLIRWNFLENTFRIFSTQDGLSNNTIYAVYEDDFKNLWLPSNYGLMRFDKISYDSQVFTDKDGIADNEFNTFAHFKDAKGTFYFGGINGVTAFHPKDFIAETKTEFPIYISDLRILKKNAEEFENLPVSRISNNPIPLNYDDQILQFECSLLDFKYMANHQYAYKIDDYHNQWIYTRDNKISIFNFPYGHHTIRVKAKGDSDLWSANELQIPIFVNKPFYLKWQFLLLSFLIFSLIVYLYLKWRIQSLEKAKLKLETEVKIRTQQIEKDKQTIEIQAEELKALDVAKSNFFANLTHELRTPLTLIIGPLEQVINNPPPTAILKRRATGILNNAKHILGLINQLLDLAKLESKQMPIELTHANIITYTEELVQRFQPLATQNNQYLKFQTNETDWFINFDCDKWDKIVYNLISNALKFTPKHGEITVQLNQSVLHGKTAIALIVTDSGIGIKEENKDAIFNRFYQTDLSSTRANDGTGVGLALVKELVDLQKGEITVSSQINIGSSFKIVLPIPTGEAGTSYKSNYQNQFLIPALKSTTSVQQTEAESLEKLDILVVEDNDDIRDYIVQCLDYNQYTISTAKNGNEGLEKALSLIPDLIISDVMMPQKDGFELVEDIRNQISTSHIPIILLSAKANIDSRLQGLKRGADAYLTKPFNPRELDVMVENLIDIRQRLQKRYTDTILTVDDDTFEKEDTFILQLKTYIQENLSETDLNGDVIGLHFGMSRIHLYRKLKALTNLSISEFVKDIRLEIGRKLLAENKLNISEISYEIGFTSPSHFSRSFKEKYGKPPSQM